MLEGFLNAYNSAARDLPQVTACVSPPVSGLTPTTTPNVTAGTWLSSARRLAYSSIPMHEVLLSERFASL